MVRLLVSRQLKGYFKPNLGQLCRIISRMVRALCLPVMGPPAVNRPFLASVAALPSTQPVLPTPKILTTPRPGSGTAETLPAMQILRLLENKWGQIQPPNHPFWFYHNRCHSR